MRKYTHELSVGCFVLIGLLCLAYLTVKLGKLEFFSTDGYAVTAKFTSITGLKSGANIEMAGVPIGKVTGVSLDAQGTRAVVRMQITANITLTDDAIASIKTSGLIGDKYVSISLGGGTALPRGGELTETESAIDIEGLISKYVFGGVK